MINQINTARYIIAIVVPIEIGIFHPLFGILTSFGVLWLNNYLDDIFFYMSSLEVKNKSFKGLGIVSPVNGIVTQIEKSVPGINLRKRDALDTEHLHEFDLIQKKIDKWKFYDHVAIYLNKFNKHIVLHPEKVVNVWRHYTDDNLEMVSAEELVSDNCGEYLNNDALVIEYKNCLMVLTMDKYISSYHTCDERTGVCCQIRRGSQCDLYFKSETYISPRVGDCVDIYDPIALVDSKPPIYEVQDEIRNAVKRMIIREGGYFRMAITAMAKTLSTFKCLWMLCFVVILPALAYITPLNTFVSYVGFSSIYLFLFVRSYRHLMYALMNEIGLENWMVKSYKFIGKAHKLWKR